MPYLFDLLLYCAIASTQQFDFAVCDPLRSLQVESKFMEKITVYVIAWTVTADRGSAAGT